MRNLTKFTAVAAGAVLAASGAHALTATGNLNVTTTVSVVCSSPSPSGNLVLPFSASNDLENQAYNSTGVTISISCDGAPTVNYVDFGPGLNRDAVTAEAEVRYMRRSGTAGDEEGHFLGYELHASKDSATFEPAAGNKIDVTSAANENRLDLNDTGASTFFVRGRVFESVGTPRAHASSGAVPSGTYNDTVVMTVDYN